MQEGARLVIVKKKAHERGKQMAKKNLEIGSTDTEILTMATAMFMRFIEENLENHKNHKDYSMDKLFALMEMYARTGDLWVRLQKLAGATQEEIAQYLQEVEE